MRLNDVKLIRLIDVDVTSRYCGKVRVKISPNAVSNSGALQHDVEFCLSKKQTTQFIKMLKSQRKRIK
jgi:hypothetical protein